MISRLQNSANISFCTLLTLPPAWSAALLIVGSEQHSTGSPCFHTGKTHAQLQQTQTSIEEQLQSGEAADPEFSAAILKRLRIHKAKAKLREIHTDLLQQHLDRTQHVPEGVDVAQEMGWGDEGDQVLCWGFVQGAVADRRFVWGS